MKPVRSLLAAAAVAALGFTSQPAQAFFGGDDEARRAIIELRQRVENERVQNQRELARITEENRRIIEENRRATEENAQLRRSMLELNNRIESLNSSLAQLRGQDEQIARELAETQRRQRDMAQLIEQRLQGTEERLKRFEPVRMTVDGRELTVEPAEQRDFEGALGIFRRGDFTAAQSAFGEFARKYPRSALYPSALFWLGNARYATRDYNGAIANFRALLQQAPDHPRAPESVLSIANCQIELKDMDAARQTLQDLVAAYPQSEAAAAARERLARLR
jgi:tol-pal system protein YbgF